MTETNLKSAHVLNCVDQRCDSNSWWTNYMLDDILFCTQLLVTHVVTTFSVGDNHDILEIYLTCGPKQQNDRSFSLSLL